MDNCGLLPVLLLYKAWPIYFLIIEGMGTQSLLSLIGLHALYNGIQILSPNLYESSTTCGSCKWCDHSSCCSVQDGEDAVEVIEIVDINEEDGSQQPGGRPRALITDGSTPSFAIFIG